MRRWFALAILIAIGLYVVLDRQVVVLQIEPLRRELGLSDLQIGLLQGLSLALFAAVVGYPIGWLADRFDRRLILGGCIAVWSIAVVFAAHSRNFGELIVASAIVGAGEAGVTPIGYALIPELFENKRRQLANSVFMVAGRFGAGLAMAAAGLLVMQVEVVRPWLPQALQALPTWRLALIASALPAIPLLVLVALLPASGAGAARRASRGAGIAAPPVLPFLRAQRRTFVGFYIGVGMLVFGFSAVGAFTPVIAVRNMGATPLAVGNAMGLATLVSTAAGLAISLLATRWLARLPGRSSPLALLSAAALLGAIASAALVFARTPAQLFTLFGIGLMCVMLGAMTFPTALQDMTPAPLRTRLVSIVIIVNTVLSALAPPLVGALSDAAKDRPDGLLWAMAEVATAGLLVAYAGMRYCTRHFASTVTAARAAEDPPG